MGTGRGTRRDFAPTKLKKTQCVCVCPATVLSHDGLFQRGKISRGQLFTPLCKEAALEFFRSIPHWAVTPWISNPGAQQDWILFYLLFLLQWTQSSHSPNVQLCCLNIQLNLG